MQKTLEILRELNEIPLVSSREEVFFPELERKVKSWLPSYTVLNIHNNLLVFPKVKKVENLLFAHTDEIGFLVKRHIGENAYELQTIGLVNIQAAHGIKVQTFWNGKKYLGVVGNILPHSGETSDKLVVEFSENVSLPPLWPVQFANEPMFTDYIFSKTLDNHIGGASLIATAQKRNLGFVLTSGEEEGTQRLRNLIKRVKEFFEYESIIVVDSCPSNQDPYYKQKTMIDEGNLGIIPVEGGGSGDKAPQKLLDKVKTLIEKSGTKVNAIETHFPDEITDATNLYKIGVEAVSIGYPLRYLHNPIEVANKKTLENLQNFLLQV